MHYLYLEEFRDGAWHFTERRPCSCHIRENHWLERPISNDRQVPSTQAA